MILIKINFVKKIIKITAIPSLDDSTLSGHRCEAVSPPK